MMERYRDYYYPSNNDRLRIKGSPSPSFPLSVKSDEKYQLSAADCTKGRRLLDCVTRLGKISFARETAAERAFLKWDTWRSALDSGSE